jgi:hypothetical protein
LGLEDRFGAREGGERLVPIPRQKQPLQIVAKALPLGERGKAIIKVGDVIF